MGVSAPGKTCFYRVPIIETFMRRSRSWSIDVDAQTVVAAATIQNPSLEDQDVNTTPHRAHFTHANIFSSVTQRAGQAPARFICVCLETIIHNSCVSSLIRTHCGLISRFPPIPLPQHIPCPLYPSHSAEQPHDPRTEGQSGRLTVQSPLTGCESNVTVEVSSAEVTSTLLPSNRESFCSVYNSGEDVTTTLVSSKVDEKQSMRMLTSPLLMQKRNTGAAPARIYHSNRQKFYVKLISPSKRKETCADVLTQKEIEKRLVKHARNTFRTRKNTDRASRSSGCPKNYEQIKQPKEKRQPYQDSLTRNIKRFSLKNKGIRYYPKQDLR